MRNGQEIKHEREYHQRGGVLERAVLAWDVEVARTVQVEVQDGRSRLQGTWKGVE